MKSDLDMKHDVEAELDWDPAARSPSIDVMVDGGVVTVVGCVDSLESRHAVLAAVRRVAGVRAVNLDVDVELPPMHQRSDGDIVRSIEDVLRWNAFALNQPILVRVDSGSVTLRGEVDWAYQRAGIERALRPLLGIVGIDNHILIRKTVPPRDLSQRIGEALQRQAEVQPAELEVEVQDGRVTMRGRVHSWHERDAAQATAWSAPGVRDVISRVEVG